MANLNAASFLNRWHIVQRATMPTPESVCWEVAGVEWRRERHAFTGGAYSFAVEVHTLASLTRDKAAWSLMVVVEHWWASGRKALKTTTWVRRLSGSSATIFAWVRDHEAARRATGRA